MSRINLCFSLRSSRLGPQQNAILERDYRTLYQPLLKFLYAHPNLKCAFSLNGIQIEFIKKKYPEYIEIARQLITRKQLELLGGGYYDPAFPLLLPVDRTGQIEKLTADIRLKFGKRPRGIALCGSIWDYSLITTFSTCGMDYVLLDESLIPADKLKFIPLIMSDKSKAITILPLNQSLKPDASREPEDWLCDIAKKVQKSARTPQFFAPDEARIVNVHMNHEELAELLKSGWLEKLCAAKSIADGTFALETPNMALKACESRIPAYIHSGMAAEIAQWGIKPYEAVKTDKRYPLTIYDFFQIYPQTKVLYSRMLYVSMLIQQSHGDKIRKNSAREKLWEAQCGDGFICTSQGAFVTSMYRQQAYKKLTEAEKILRECEPFTESLTAFDYFGDGMKSYIFRMQRYFAVVSKSGGAIRELDIFQNFGNFADNLTRAKEFEGFDDDYDRGLFVDHIFDDKEFHDYLENKPVGNGIFSKYMYSEQKFSDQHREICLEATALYQNKQKISLRKKYIPNSNGMMVQYILKNESDSILNAKFAVESSFAQTNFNEKDFNAFRLEILSDSQKQQIDTKSSSYMLNDTGVLSDVEGIWLTDTDNNVTFVFEPNETCGLSFVPLIFRRPEYTGDELVPAAMTFACTLYWDIELAPGMEMEKTVNFTIFNPHKRR